MSGVHFEIENFGNVAELRDRNSTNKTWVNHVCQMKCRLNAGDVIRAGKTVFTVQWDPIPGESDAEAPDQIVKTFDDSESKIVGVANFDSSLDDDSKSSLSPIGSVAYAKDRVTQNSERKPPHVDDIPIPDKSSNSHPFESLGPSDWSKIESRHEEHSFIPPTKEISREDFSSPFDDSSIFNSPFSMPVAPKPIPLATSQAIEPSRSSPTRVVQSPNQAKVYNAWRLIEVLSKQCDLKVVVHYKKIGQLTPSSMKIHSVFPFLADAWEYLPVIVDGSEWIKWEGPQTTDRLVLNDGFVVVLTTGKFGTEAELESLCSCEVSRFSESKGFLGWCWPSQLHAMLNSGTDATTASLFGRTVLGFLYQSECNWIAFADPEILPALAAVGFE